MNNIFNIKRFGWVLQKDFRENWKRYSLQFLTMFGIIMLVFLFSCSGIYKNILEGYTHENRINATLLGLSSVMFYIFGVLMASTLMEPMRNKTKRIVYLLNPASNFEKIFSRWLIVTVMYIVGFFVALCLADAVRVMFFSLKYPELNIHMIDFSKLIGTHDEFNTPSSYLFAVYLCMYLFIQSLFVLGATFWEKATFVKTFSACVIISLLFVLICRWVILIAYDGDINSFANVMNSFMPLHVSDKKMLFLSPSILFTLTNWTIAFLRFRESEIIKRL